MVASRALHPPRKDKAPDAMFTVCSYDKVLGTVDRQLSQVMTWHDTTTLLWLTEALED